VPRVAGPDLVLGPQRPEPLALALEGVDQPRKAGVADAARVLGAEAGQRCPSGVVPLLAGLPGAREQPPEEIRRPVGPGGRNAEQPGRGRVPGEHVGSWVEQVGGVRDERVDEGLKLGRRVLHGAVAGKRQLDAREVEQVGALAGVHVEHAGERVEHLRGTA